MNIITIIEELENESYLVEYNMDGETWETEMSIQEVRATLLNPAKDTRVEFECYVEFDVVTVEHYDGEFDINVNTYKYTKHDNDLVSKFVKTYKTFKGACNNAKKHGDYVQYIGCELY